MWKECSLLNTAENKPTVEMTHFWVFYSHFTHFPGVKKSDYTVAHLLHKWPRSLSSALSCLRKNAGTSCCRWRRPERVFWCHRSVRELGRARLARRRSPDGRKHTPDGPPCRSRWKPERNLNEPLTVISWNNVSLGGKEGHTSLIRWPGVVDRIQVQAFLLGYLSGQLGLLIVPETLLTTWSQPAEKHNSRAEQWRLHHWGVTSFPLPHNASALWGNFL